MESIGWVVNVTIQILQILVMPQRKEKWRKLFSFQKHILEDARPVAEPSSQNSKNAERDRNYVSNHANVVLLVINDAKCESIHHSRHGAVVHRHRRQNFRLPPSFKRQQTSHHQRGALDQSYSCSLETQGRRSWVHIHLAAGER